MTSRLCTWAFAGVLAVSSARLLADAPTAAFTPGPLRIHVTAIEGGAQFRASGQTKWQTLRGQPDLPEGAELRTGPKGVIQFTVGDDQVYRVDRLSLVQVLRAESIDGKIKTVVGMTYGRVSKDVDAPVLPHEDSIVSPSATLAVRGTRVSLYDQPPYEPEAISLTGQASFRFKKGPPLIFGSHGGGTVQVVGDSTNPPQFQAQAKGVDPLGNFAGRTDSEEATVIAFGGIGGADPNGLGSSIAGPPFMLPNFGGNGSNGNGNNGNGNNGNGNNGNGNGNGGNPNTLTGELNILLSWGGPPEPQITSIVDFTVRSPLGEVISINNQSVASGGFYKSGGNTIAGPNDVGQQEVSWGTSPSGSVPIGKYKITETLVGTTTQTLAQDPGLTVTTRTFAQQFTPVSGQPSKESLTPTNFQTLTAADPTVTYTFRTPLVNSTPLSIKH